MPVTGFPGRHRLLRLLPSPGLDRRIVRPHDCRGSRCWMRGHNSSLPGTDLWHGRALLRAGGGAGPHPADRRKTRSASLSFPPQGRAVIDDRFGPKGYRQRLVQLLAASRDPSAAARSRPSTGEGREAVAPPHGETVRLLVAERAVAEVAERHAKQGGEAAGAQDQESCCDTDRIGGCRLRMKQCWRRPEEGSRGRPSGRFAFAPAPTAARRGSRRCWRASGGSSSLCCRVRRCTSSSPTTRAAPRRAQICERFRERSGIPLTYVARAAAWHLLCPQRLPRPHPAAVRLLRLHRR